MARRARSRGDLEALAAVLRGQGMGRAARAMVEAWDKAEAEMEAARLEWEKGIPGRIADASGEAGRAWSEAQALDAEANRLSERARPWSAASGMDEASLLRALEADGPLIDRRGVAGHALRFLTPRGWRASRLRHALAGTSARDAAASLREMERASEGAAAARAAGERADDEVRRLGLASAAAARRLSALPEPARAAASVLREVCEERESGAHSSEGRAGRAGDVG